MIRFIWHVRSSHVEYKCIFIWVFNWYLCCCSSPASTTCTEIGILESSGEAISIWMEVSFGQYWHLPGILLVQKVKMRQEGSTTRCKIQTSPCVFSSYSTCWLKIYHIYQLWISSAISMHEIKTSRSTDLRNCQGKKLDLKKKNWITCEISITLSFFFFPPTLIGIANRPARSQVASGKWITKWNIEGFLIKSLKKISWMYM